MLSVPRRLNRNKLPEHAYYSDDGCEVAARCVDCPLEICRFEEPNGIRSAGNRVRDRLIQDAYLSFVPINEIAATYGVSRRTVFNITKMVQRGENRVNGYSEAEELVREVAARRGVSYAQLFRPGQTQAISGARKEAAQRLKERFPAMPLKAIARQVGVKDHSSVLYMLNGRKKCG